MDNLTMARRKWEGDSGERGLQDLLQRTQGQNQGKGRGVGGTGVQLGCHGGMGREGIEL